MDNHDWLSELFDKPNSALNSDQLKKKATIYKVAAELDSANPSPWSEEVLVTQRNKLLGNLPSRENLEQSEQPLRNDEITMTDNVRPFPSRMSTLARNIAPFAMAASVAIVAIIMVPLSNTPDVNGASLQSLLDEAGLPSGYRPEILGGSNSKGATVADDDEASLTRIKLDSPNRSAFELIEYLHEARLPYVLTNETGANRIKIYVSRNQVNEFNRRIEKLNIEPVSSGIVELSIESKASQ